MHHLKAKIDEAVSHIRKGAFLVPELGMILGSGLGTMADEIESPYVVPFEEIPYFALSTIEGHAGKLVLGHLEGKSVVAMKGRLHYYEGYGMDEISFPVRVMRALGAKTLIVTNASGGINRNYKAGDLMIMRDHINLMGANPLRGRNDPALGPRFPDMARTYTPELIDLAMDVAIEEKIPLHKGVYVAVSGPSYETKAEIEFFGRVGADVVGMSTVPEVIVAAHAGLQVLGISCITNTAWTLHSTTHEEVLETTEKIRDRFSRLIRAIIRKL